MQNKYRLSYIIKICLDALVAVFIAFIATALGLLLLNFIYNDIESVLSSYQMLCILWIAQILGFSYLFWRKRSHQYIFIFAVLFFIPSVIANINSFYYLFIITMHYMTSIIFVGILPRLLRR
jgi:hypothetical protein